MRLSTPNCPECGEPAAGTVDTLSGVALFEPAESDGDRDFDYCGWTRVDWDVQRSQRDARGRVLLTCEDGHEWYSADENLSAEEARQRAHASHFRLPFSEADAIADIIERELLGLDALPGTPAWGGFTAPEREHAESKARACRVVLERLGRI